MSHAPELERIEQQNLPTPRQSALQLIQACTRPNVAAKELVTLAEKDAALTIELLRVVNTPFFGLASEVKSVARAVTILGQRALRNMALCLAVKDALRPDDIAGLDAKRHWEETLRHAVAAKLLAEKVSLDSEESFTLGLLQDCGMLIMFLNNPQPADQVSQFLDADPENRLGMEQERFGFTHDAVAAFLCERWHLPDEITLALGNHHNLDSDDIESVLPQSRLLLCADWLAAVYAAQEKAPVLDRCRKLLHEHFQLESEITDQLLKAIPEQVENAAAALNVHINQQLDFQEILREANLQLSEENISYQELTWRLEKTLRERDALAAELNREIEMAREIQRSLLPPPLDGEALVVGVNVPARDLSGDFYDFFTLPDGSILFNLGDVSGKGMNAALLMAKTSSLFRCLGKRTPDPGTLLQQINDEICETSVRGMFVTIAAGLYDPANDAIRFANAGHPPALLFRDGKLAQSYGAQAPPLGVMPDVTFPSCDISLAGGTLFVVSDGITEAHTADNQQLGVKGLVSMIATSGKLPPRRRLESIVEKLRTTPEVLHDDMTILMVGNHGSR